MLNDIFYNVNDKPTGIFYESSLNKEFLYGYDILIRNILHCSTEKLNDNTVCELNSVLVRRVDNANSFL